MIPSNRTKISLLLAYCVLVSCVTSVRHGVSRTETHTTGQLRTVLQNPNGQWIPKSTPLVSRAKMVRGIRKTRYRHRFDRFGESPMYELEVAKKCNGRDNMIQDVGLLSLIIGTIGTILSIFSASYFSVIGNTISLASGIISFLTGFPSAVLTYLSASDPLSYLIGNGLSILGLLNTAYGLLSVNYGNKDIFLSQFANVIGVISLVLSIITAYPSVFDSIVSEIQKGSSPQMRRKIRRTITNYGCHDNPTYYQYSESIVKFLNRL